MTGLLGLVGILRAADRNGPATRARVLVAIRGRPGITKSEIVRVTGLSWGTVAHHLRILEQAQAIVKTPAGGMTQFRLPSVSSHQAMMVRLLSSEVPASLVKQLVANPDVRMQELSLALGLSRKIIRRHLTTLEEAGFVRRSTDYHPRFRLLPAASFLVGGPVDGGRRDDPVRGPPRP